MSIDRQVSTSDVELIELTTPRDFRNRLVAELGDVFKALPPALLRRIPTPEEELKGLLARMLPGDELWIARSRVFEPQALIGSWGIAVVRSGQPIWYRAVR